MAGNLKLLKSASEHNVNNSKLLFKSEKKINIQLILCLVFNFNLYYYIII